MASTSNPTLGIRRETCDTDVLLFLTKIIEQIGLIIVEKTVHSIIIESRIENHKVELDLEFCSFLYRLVFTVKLYCINIVCTILIL